MNTSNTETVTVNEVEIICPLHNDQNYVAIKPICQALGISHSAQWRRIQNDEILNSVVAELATTGSDNKQYKMVCIPVKFVFGWLFSIDISKVKGEAKPIMQKYKLECYETLYDRFYLRAHLYEKKMQMILQKKDQIEALERDMATNRRKLNEEKEKQMTINELIIHLAQIEDKTQKVFFHVGECSTPYVEVLRVEPGEQRVLNLYSVDPPEKVDVLILAGK